MYYDFLKNEYEFDNSVKLPSSNIDKLNIVIDVIKYGNDEETDEKPCDLVSNPILKEFLDNIPFGYLTSFEHVFICRK